MSHKDYRGTGRMGRRRALGVGAAGFSAAWLAACGGGGGSSSTSSNGGTGGAQATLTTNAPVATVAAGEQAKPGGSVAIRIATTAPLDPIANTTYTAQTIASFAYSRLMKFKTDNTPTTADNFEVAPDLASGFEQTADGLQFTFKLRDAAFHQKPPIAGRKVDSDDVKATLDRFRSDTKNTNRNVFGSPQTPLVDKVETPDKQTVVFKLAKPFGPFLPLVATAQYLWIMPKELAASAFDPAKDQIGTGPYVYDSTQPDIEIKYKKNPNYFITARPYVDEFRHVVLPDSVQESVQFQARRLDLAAIPYDQIADIKKSNPDAASFETKPGTLAFLAPQQRANSVFKDERIRKALSMAVDRDSLLKLTWNGAGVYQNMVPSSFGKWYIDPKSADSGPGAPFYQFNPKEAVALLKAAGYDESKKLQFKYYFTPNGYTQRFNQLAEATASMLKETKILDPTVVTADYQGEYIKTGGIFFGAYEGVFFGLQSGYNDPHDYLFNPLHSASQRNHVGVSDPRLDELISKQQGATVVEERVKLVHEIQKYTMDKMYYPMMSYGPDYTFLQPWVRNYYARRGYGAGAESVLDMWLNK